MKTTTLSSGQLEQFYDDGESRRTDQFGADGTVEDWYADITVDDGWVDDDEAYTLVYARALNEVGEALLWMYLRFAE